MKNKQTTGLGIALILGAIGTALTAYFDGDPTTAVNFELLIGGIMTGIVAIKARQQDQHDAENGK